jgi:hypothetical protein
MKNETKHIIHGRGMNSDVQTVRMLHQEASNILKAEEVSEGAYRITMISGEEKMINEDEMNYLRDLCSDSVNNDFDIYYLNGDVVTAVV